MRTDTAEYMKKVNIQKSHPVTMCTAVVLPKHLTQVNGELLLPS